MSFLKGTIFITDKEDIIYQTPLDGITRIINLDEDGILMENDAIICGTCLLPPVEAKIAEADGKEQLYDILYCNHLLDYTQQNFISAIISYLYKGGNFILFLPELGYTNTMDKLIFHMYDRFGIHIGKINDPNPYIANCYYDDKCIPIWLNMIYFSNVISPYEYLAQYPIDAQITQNKIMEKLIFDLSPYGCKDMNSKIQFVLDLHKKLHKNPKLISPIYELRR